MKDMYAQVKKGDFSIYLRFSGKLDMWVSAVYVGVEVFYKKFVRLCKDVIHISDSQRRRVRGS